MSGTYRQNRHGPGHRLTDVGVTGIGWIIWAIGKIFLTPRSMRIGLSGLLLWVGVPGVGLAQQTPSQPQRPVQSQSPGGAIKDPFNPQGYMLEMAAKMNDSKPSNAVFGENGISRSRKKPGDAVPLTPSTSNVTWLSGSDNKTGAAPSDSSVKWMTPSGEVVRGPAPSESIPNQMGWRPSQPGAAPGPATPSSGTGLTRWLNGAPQTSEQAAPADPIPGQPGWRPAPDRATSTTLGPQPSVGFTKWLTPGPQATPQAQIAAPAPSTPAAPAAPTAPATSPTMGSSTGYQGPPRSALPPTPMRQATWLEPTAQPAPQPMIARPVTQPVARPTVPAPARQEARRTILPETPLRQMQFLEPAPQPAPQANPSLATQAPPPADRVVGSQPETPKTTTDEKTWLSTDNRAAQLALEAIRKQNASPRENQAVQATNEAVTSESTYSFGDISKHTPESLNRIGSQPTSQMLQLSGGPAGPSTSPLADDPTNYAATDLSQARNFYEQERRPWSLGTDLDQYRAHAVREGTRDTGASLAKALERIGLAIEDSTNIITLGYASDRGEPFRGNDGKGLFDVPDRVPAAMGATAASFGSGLYSLADLITFDGLPDADWNVYKDNHPLVRPMIFTGRTIGGVWKTTEEIGNAVTWGYFDNVTGSIYMCIEDIIEVLKHAGQAVTNLARVPVHLVAGENREGADRALDWVLLVPLEFASNVFEMKGIANTDDYKTAFADKGVIGSLLEFGGSTFLVYRAVDDLVDDLKDDHRKHRKSSGDSAEPEPETPEPEIPVDTTTPEGTWTDFVFSEDGVFVGTRTP